MKILNLYAGLGGNRTLWSEAHEVTAVESHPVIARIYSKRFPKDRLFCGKVENYLENYDISGFDLIWASPPCVTHSQMQKFRKYDVPPLPRMQDIYGLMIWLKWWWLKDYWVIENVQPYYKALVEPTARIDRHLFWANFPIKSKRFREKRKGHGSLSNSHVMRDTIPELIEKYLLTDIEMKLKPQWIRNCVDPRIGKYILDQCMNKKPLLSYIDA